MTLTDVATRGRVEAGRVVLAPACDVAPDRLLELLDEAIAAGVLVHLGTRRYGFSHGIIRDALRDAPTVVLQDLLQGVRDRVVVAVTFLALLELMKRREIVVEQAEPWGPIVARSTTAEERAVAGVAAQSDEPLDESLESFA